MERGDPWQKHAEKSTSHLALKLHLSHRGQTLPLVVVLSRFHRFVGKLGWKGPCEVIYYNPRLLLFLH